MNAPVSRSSAALLLAGALAILLLGAFSRDPSAPVAALPVLSADSSADAVIESAGGPELPTGISLGLAEIIRMAQARVDENVILTFIQNSGQSYSPTADEILYLSDLGLSQTVIGALFKQKPSAPTVTAAVADTTPVPAAKPSPPDAPPPAREADTGAFYKALAPYGSWTQVPDFGLCWQPTVQTLNPDWTPYVDQGQWLYTDNGWYWQSGYSWGWAAFHYGRWSKNSRLGWVWVPDKVWGPAWVSWRIALSYSGWAPLPPGVGLAAATGLTFNNHRVAADFDFGLPVGWFTFVSEANFLNCNLPNYAVPASQAAAIYIRSMPVNNYSVANHKVINLGPGRPAIAAAAEAKTTPMLINRPPTANRAPAVESQFALENEASPFVATVSTKGTVNTPPRQKLALPAQPPPQLEKLPRQHSKETYPAYSSLASATRWEALNAHEPVRHEQNTEALVRAPQPDAARMIAVSVPTSSKSGK